MKTGIVIVFLLLTGNLFAASREIEDLVSRFDYTASEKTAILAIFDDAKTKGIDQAELAAVLKEQALKKSSYYEAVEALARRQKEIDVVRTSGFPGLDRPKIRSIAGYLVRIYTVRQFLTLSEALREKDEKADRVEDLFEFQIALFSFGVTANDLFVMTHTLVRSGYTDSASLDSIRSLYLRSRDWKLDRRQVTRQLNGGLAAGRELKLLVREIRTKSRNR